MKKILIVGQLGYHEENIIKPIINQLLLKNYTVDRLGGNWDFFIKNNYNSLLKNYYDSIPDNITKYDVILFVDFWNMIVPQFAYLKSITNSKVKFVSLFHGSVKLKNDVAKNIISSNKYEEYLLDVYDTIIVPKLFIKKLLNSKKDNIRVISFPLDNQISRGERNFKLGERRIIFSHRFEDDKGKNKFIEFANFCMRDEYLNTTELIVTQDQPKGEVFLPNIKFIGKQSQDQLKNLCCKGGYAWSSVESETWGYTIFDLLSYGLHPLLNYHPAYDNFPNKLKYRNFNDIKKIFKNGTIMNNLEWRDLILNCGFGAKEIMGVLCE